MAHHKGRKPNKPVTEPVEQSELARVMSGRGATPSWKRFLDQRLQEDREEQLKYKGGPTGERLQG